MGISQNYFKKAFGKLNIKEKRNGAAIEINFERMGKRFDIAQDKLDAQVWSDMQKYMPKDLGNLIKQTSDLNACTRGEVYVYDPIVEYGHYQYEGWQYVDPKYGVAGFYDKENDKYFSREDITKVKGDKPLFYSNPLAEAHWDEKAYQMHHKAWVQCAKNAIKKV